jgi:hypothetical protein
MKSFILLFCLFSTRLFAQSLSQTERQLFTHLHRIKAMGDAREQGAHADFDDSLEIENNRVGGLLEKLTLEKLSSLTYDFPKLSGEGLIDIISSKDGRFRIYSWDMRGGGIVPTYGRVYQFRTGDRVWSLVSLDNFGQFSGIFTLTANEKRYYLAISNTNVSTAANSETIEVFCPVDSTLSDTAASIIRTRSGLTHRLSYEYTISDPLIDEASISYNPDTKTIRLPVILDGGRITKKKIVYQFNGTCFERIKN